MVEGEKQNWAPASAALLAAQARLDKLRQQKREERRIELASCQVKNGRFPHSPSPTAISGPLPPHLGWDSPAITAVLPHQKSPQPANTWPALQQPAPITSPSPPPHASVKVYPDVALGMLRQELTAPGRIWLLLHHLDASGRGWVNGQNARQQLTRKRAPLRVCGERQWRNLLAQGEGVFWRQENGRIWLRAVAKVALALGTNRLTGRPVALPVSALTQGIGQVRAHFYASFHSGRQKENTPAPPIARATLHRLTHVQPRTQRRYEQQAQVQRKSNFALGQPITPAEREAAVWQQGTAVFQLQDKMGLQGPRNNSYLAWQLPNQYTGPHLPQPKGRQKQINRALADLFMQGMTGNGAQAVDTVPARRYFGHGKAAARVLQRQPGKVVYWPALEQRPLKKQRQFWHALQDPS